MKSSLTFLVGFLVLCCFSGWAQPFPLKFNFESPPTFDPQYFTAHPNWSGQNGLVDIANGNGANGTAYYVRLGKINDQGGLTINALDLKLNLSNCQDKELEFSFWFQFFNDNPQNDDGVFFSDDGGVNFEKVIALDPSKWCNTTWGSFQTFDLDGLLEQFGLEYTSNFIIQFRHQGSGDFSTSGDEDGMLIDEINIVEAQKPQPFKLSASQPFFESFASGEEFEPYWSVRHGIVDMDGIPGEGTTTHGSVHISYSANSVDGDNYSLFLGKWGDCGGENISWADLHLDLTGLGNSDLDFKFYFKYFYDATHFQEGIWLSDDGGKTTSPLLIPAIALRAGDWEENFYGRFQTFDLDALIKEHMLSFSNDFVIRFKQVGSGDWSTSGEEDGLFIDAIEIEVAPPVVYKNQPFCDDFEVDSIFEKHWRYGYAELNANGIPEPGTTPSVLTRSAQWGSDNRALAAGKANDHNGETISRLDLHLNLANTDSVEVHMKRVDFYNEWHAAEGIWISTDGGVSFHPERIYNFKDEPDSNDDFNTLTFALTDSAEAKNIVLTSQTVLRFQQVGTGDFSTSGPEDGLVLDSVCVTGKFPPPPPPSGDTESVSSFQFRVFPNPARNILHVSWKTEQSEELRLEVFDLTTGRQVFAKLLQSVTEGQTDLDVSMLAAGAYLLQIQTDKWVHVERFVKAGY